MFVLSSPLLINKSKVPEDVLEFWIDHLILFADPDDSEPLISTGLVLFIIVPSEIVVKVNALPLVIAPAVLPDTKEEVAAEYEPLTTLVTSKVSPPLAKKLYAAIDVKNEYTLLALRKVEPNLLV